MFEFCLLLFIYMGIVLAVCLPYLYELGNTACEDIPTPPMGVKRLIKLWFEAAWFAFLLGLAFILDPIARRLEKPLQSPDNTLPPLLLVHGLYHNPTGWFYLRRHLRKTGFGAIHTVKYTSWRTNIHAATNTLDAAITALEKQYPGRKPVLVGHSLGGLLIRNWLATEANQARALGALTFGAPHRGSKIAALAFGALGKSLLPANAFFADLAKQESPASIPCVSLVSEADTMVLPQQNLVPVTPGWAMRVTPYATHTGIIIKNAVLRMAIWELYRMAKGGESSESAARQTPAPMENRTVTTPAVFDTTPAPETAPSVAEEPVPAEAVKSDATSATIAVSTDIAASAAFATPSKATEPEATGAPGAEKASSPAGTTAVAEASRAATQPITAEVTAPVTAPETAETPASAASTTTESPASAQKTAPVMENTPPLPFHKQPEGKKDGSKKYGFKKGKR